MENSDYSLSFCEEKIIPTIKSVVDRHLAISFRVEKKGHGNFVTSTDKEIEKELKIQLHELNLVQDLLPKKVAKIQT